MAPIAPDDARAAIEAAVTGFSVLGGAMAYTSGYYAAQALAQQRSPELLAQRVNEGIGQGFNWGCLPALLAFIIVAWS